MNPGIFLRLKFAWCAFWMVKYEHVFPYEYYCNLRKDMEAVCDNNRRTSKCTNMATVALADPGIKIEINKSNWFYHVCDSCAKKYIGTDGEEFMSKEEIQCQTKYNIETHA